MHCHAEPEQRCETVFRAVCKLDASACGISQHYAENTQTAVLWRCDVKERSSFWLLPPLPLGDRDTACAWAQSLRLEKDRGSLVTTSAAWA